MRDWLTWSTPLYSEHNWPINSDCELLSQLVQHSKPIYFERVPSPVGRNALICSQKYLALDIQRVNGNMVLKWFDSTITDELLSKVLVLLELIFIRDGSFEVAAIGATPLYSRQDVISFISLICTCIDWC